MNISRRRVLEGMAFAATTTAALSQGTAFAQELDIDNATAMANVRDVVIGGFNILFLTNRVDRARAGGGLLGGGFGGRSTARTALAGLSDADFQGAVDAAYDDFLQQLQAAGYIVHDRAPFLAALSRHVRPLDNGVSMEFTLSRNNEVEGRLFSPTTLGPPMVPQDVQGAGFSGGGMGAVQSAVYVRQDSLAYARTNNIAVLFPHYVVDFASAETYGGWFRNSSAVSVSAGLAVTPEGSLFIAYAPGNRTTLLAPEEPIAVGGDFGSFSETSTDGQRAGELAANVIGALGGVGTNRTQRHTMQANPAQWSAGVGDLARTASARFIQGLRDGR